LTVQRLLCASDERDAHTVQFALGRNGRLAHRCGLVGSARAATNPAGGSVISFDSCGQMSRANAFDVKSPTKTMPIIPDRRRIPVSSWSRGDIS
jgi:hypothetical protein